MPISFRGSGPKPPLSGIRKPMPAPARNPADYVYVGSNEITYNVLGLKDSPRQYTLHTK